MRALKLPIQIGVFGLLALGGCAAGPKVVAVDQHAYHLTAVGAPYESQAATNHKALIAANSFCSTQGKALMFRHSAESGVHAWSAKSEDLTFVCMDADDPSFMRAGFKQQEQTTVVAQQ